MIYIVNVVVLISGVGLLTRQRFRGAYRCKSVLVSFGDAVWEEAFVEGVVDPQVLIYSHFNGIYKGEHPLSPSSFVLHCLATYMSFCRN